MSCLAGLSLSAMAGSILSGLSGIFGVFNSCFGKEKKPKNETNINSHNSRHTEIHDNDISITTNNHTYMRNGFKSEGCNNISDNSNYKSNNKKKK